MPSFHKLVKTNEVGMVLLQELDRESPASQDLLEATKKLRNVYLRVSFRNLT